MLKTLGVHSPRDKLCHPVWVLVQWASQDNPYVFPPGTEESFPPHVFNNRNPWFGQVTLTGPCLLIPNCKMELMTRDLCAT